MPVLKYASILILPLLAACGGTTAPRPATSAPPPAARPAQSPPPMVVQPTPSPQVGQFRAPRIMSLPGVEGLIGANAGSITRQFGTPRLDVREGDVRKLQFAGESCVLDVFLYPVTPGAEPTATYVDARRSSDGLDVDRVACVRSLLAR
jgi:hypothetical protein